MPLSEAKLLEELDQHAIINWAVELKNGKEAYEFLMRTIGSDALNVRQTLNALHALFKIRGHGDSKDLLQKYVDLFGHSVLSIRSEAVQLAIGLVRFSRRYDKEPLFLSEEQRLAVRSAMARGLTNKVSSVAAEFLMATSK